MPGFKDLAAFPTSWALTLWDALPLFLAVETALAIVVLAVLPGTLRGAGWRLGHAGIVGGLVYLLLFNSDLALPFALLGVASLAATYRLRRAQAGPAPGESVSAGVRARAWDVIGSVAAAGALAAGVKVLAGPYLASDNPIWLLVAMVGGALPFGTFGTAALPALAVAAATDSVASGSVWLVAAALRPLLTATVAGFVAAGQRASAPYD